MDFKKITYAMGLAGLLCSAGAMASSPLSFSKSEVGGQPKVMQMPGLDNAKLRQREEINRAMNPRDYVLQFAEPLKVSLSPDKWQKVQVINEGKASEMSVWRMQITSAGALSLNFGFTQFEMPEGGSLHIYTPDRSQRIRAFTAADNDAHGQLWTPMLAGDSAIIEVNVPAHKEKQLKLELTSVNHGYLGANVKDIFDTLSGACNVDVVCPAGDDWRDQIRSAAAISLGGSRFCSGGALNNTANDGRAFFLTAYHCGVNAGNAASLVTYWNFENSYCRDPGSSDSGGQGDGTLDQFNTGSIFRAGYSPSDMTLVELDDPFDPAHNVFLAGWNANDETSTSAVAIHHPNVDEKRISFENEATTITSYGGNSSPGDSTHIRVIDWDLGTTEGGSSGSHLFDQNKRVIGQLHGGGAACGNDLSDWYGRIYTSWDGGGTASTRLSTWLDAAGTGEMAIDGMNATDPGDNQLPVVNANGPYLAFVDTAVNFSSAGTEDPDGTVVSLEWDFGDGSDVSSEANPSHVYTAKGNYEVSLKATDDDDASRTVFTQANVFDPTQDELMNGVAKTGLSGETGEETYFYMQVPSGATNLQFVTQGDNGDADLYVSQGQLPTTSSFDCRSWSGSSNETCSFPTPEAGTWYAMVRAYSGYSDLSLTGSYEGGQTNEPPVAGFDASFSGALGSFTSTSTDSDGSITDWSWDFGDGNTGSGEMTSHTYAASGSYRVTLTVTDDGGAQDSDSQTFDVTVPDANIDLEIGKVLKSRRGSVRVSLSWEGSTGDYTVSRDGEDVGTTGRTRYTDRFRVSGSDPVTVTYKVCGADGGCSAEVPVVIE
ncbi:PKD domain-containing protein [Shewanella corallii]|uniref:PKD domain-containing protein n=1 Tax=Shewanella corallii TaxID=560080 RepID=A0ABT0NCH4_9GAMM|nr:PKD domain-containing protein [Shewanella corallii]MCL2916194.1 PKD domain-containing protein [Shewanella corallii]